MPGTKSQKNYNSSFATVILPWGSWYTLKPQQLTAHRQPCFLFWGLMHVWGLCKNKGESHSCKSAQMNLQVPGPSAEDSQGCAGSWWMKVLSSQHQKEYSVRSSSQRLCCAPGPWEVGFSWPEQHCTVQWPPLSGASRPVPPQPSSCMLFPILYSFISSIFMAWTSLFAPLRPSLPIL